VSRSLEVNPEIRIALIEECSVYNKARVFPAVQKLEFRSSE